MLTPSDIRHLSDKDLTHEIQKASITLFRQKMGVRTGHLKDSHIINQLKKFIARLNTVATDRKHKKHVVADTTPDITKKIADMATKMEKSQAPKKKATKATKTSEKESADVTSTK